MSDFVKNLGQDWFLFKYEDMIAKNYDAINAYLGFDVREDAEVPTKTGKAKVVRKKSTGDWRHWFTEEDVNFFKPAYIPYMEIMGYNCNDWAINPDPVIEPEYSSKYMQQLVKKKSLHSLLSFKDRVLKRLTKT